MASFEVRESGPGRGRGLFALRDIKCGELVIEEDAQYAQNDQENVLVCDRCLAFVGPLTMQLDGLAAATGVALDKASMLDPLSDFLPARLAPAVACGADGCTTIFCSTECRDAAHGEYHGALCPPLLANDAARDALASLQAHPNRQGLVIGVVLRIVGRLVCGTRGADRQPLEAVLEAAVGRYQQPSFTKLIFAAMGVPDTPEERSEFQNADLVPVVDALRKVVADSPHVADAVTLDWLDGMLGMCSTNGRDVQIFSPGQAMLDYLALPATVARLQGNADAEQARKRLGIWATVVARKLDLKELPGVHGVAIFPDYSMLNHDCDCNVGPDRVHPETGRRDIAMGDRSARGTVYALRDIAQGEELLTSYIDPSLPVEDRRLLLRRGYGFDCACATCVAEASGLSRPALPDVDEERSKKKKKKKRSNNNRKKSGSEAQGDVEAA